MSESKTSPDVALAVGGEPGGLVEAQPVLVKSEEMTPHKSAAVLVDAPVAVDTVLSEETGELETVVIVGDVVEPDQTDSKASTETEEDVEVEGTGVNVESSPAASTSAKRKRGRPRKYGRMARDLELSMQSKDGKVSSPEVTPKRPKRASKLGSPGTSGGKTDSPSMSTPRRGSRVRKPPTFIDLTDNEKLASSKDSEEDESSFEVEDKETGGNLDSENESVSEKSSLGSPSKGKMKACRVCHKVYKRDYFPIHMQTHEKNRPRHFKCEKCDGSFLSAGALKLHGSVHSGDRPWVCETCGASFKQKGNLQQHTRIHERKEGDKEFKCEGCSKQFHAKRAYEGHLKHHAGIFEHTCETCGRLFADKESLRSHMRSHNEKNIICDVCGEKLSSQGTLRNHKLIHTGDKPFECATCRKRFRNMTTYQRHLTTHSDERPYICDVCGLSFKWPLYLTRHKIVHSDAKNYQCSQCEKSFKRKEHLKLHLRTHTGERPFVCPYCGKRFSQSCSLKQHEGIHVNRNHAKLTPGEMEAALGVKFKGDFDINCAGIEIISDKLPEWKAETGKMYIHAKDIVQTENFVSPLSRKVKRLKREKVIYDDDDDDDFDDDFSDSRSEDENFQDIGDDFDDECSVDDAKADQANNEIKVPRAFNVVKYTGMPSQVTPTPTSAATNPSTTTTKESSNPLLATFKQAEGVPFVTPACRKTNASATVSVPEAVKSPSVTLGDECTVVDHTEVVEMQPSASDIAAQVPSASDITAQIQIESPKVQLHTSSSDYLGDRMVYFLIQPGSEPVPVILDRKVEELDATAKAQVLQTEVPQASQDLTFVLTGNEGSLGVTEVSNQNFGETVPVAEAQGTAENTPGLQYPSVAGGLQYGNLRTQSLEQITTAVSSIQDFHQEEDLVSIEASSSIKVEAQIIPEADPEPLKTPDQNLSVVQIDSANIPVGLEGNLVHVQTDTGTFLTLTPDQLEAFLNSNVAQGNPAPTKSDASNESGIKFIKIEAGAKQPSPESEGQTKVFSLPSGKVLPKDRGSLTSPYQIVREGTSEVSGSASSDRFEKTAVTGVEKPAEAVAETSGCLELAEGVNRTVNKEQSSATVGRNRQGDGELSTSTASLLKSQPDVGSETEPSDIEAAHSLMNFIVDVANQSKKQSMSESSGEEEGPMDSKPVQVDLKPVIKVSAADTDTPGDADLDAELVPKPRKRGRPPKSSKASPKQGTSLRSSPRSDRKPTDRKQGRGRKIEDEDVRDGVDYDQKTGRCLVCSKIYKNSSYLVQHARLHKGLETRYSCEVCAKCFPSAGNLKLHMTMHNPASKMYKCPDCGRGFAQKANMEDHRRIHLRKEGQKDFYCDHCGKGFNSKSHMHGHRKIHEGKLDYMCQKCGKTFPSKHAMKSHLVSHEETRNWICDTCGAGVKTLSALRIHRRIHTGARPHSCDKCEKAFYDKSTLLRHMVTHSDDRPFTCPVCGFAFKWKLYLTRHMIIHSNKMEFTCSECGKGFKRCEHLKLHMRTHTGEKPYKCKFCAQSFSQTSSCRMHERTHLKDKPVVVVH